MPIIFRDTLVSNARQTPLPLIRDIHISGGFMVLASVEERDALPVALLSRGQIVRTMETNQFWKVSNFVATYDDDWNEIITIEWELYDFGGPAPSTDAPRDKPKPFQLKHTNFTLKIDGVADGKPIAHIVDLDCYSFFLLNLRCSQPCRVEIYSRKDLLDRAPYTFLARYDHLVDNGDSLVTKKEEPDFTINSCAYSIICNEDDRLGRLYYFRVTPMQNLTLNESGYSSNLITVAFDYVTIET